MPHVLGALLKEVGTVVADGDAAGGKGGDDAGRQTSSQQQLKDEKDVRADRGKREKNHAKRGFQKPKLFFFGGVSREILKT